MSVNIWITGASRGIGLGIAIEIAKYYNFNGVAANIAINSRSAEDITTSAHTIEQYGAKVLALTGDISNSSDRIRMYNDITAAFGPLDILINNAGISYIGLLQDMTSLELNTMLSINLEAAIALSSMVIPDLLRSTNSPRIINISSVWGNVGASCEVAYSAAKGGLNAFTKALAKELAPSHIPVNAIACGYIETSMNDHLTTAEKQELFDEIPAGRPGSAEEIGQSVVLLLQATDYLTGQIITIDGGWT